MDTDSPNRGPNDGRVMLAVAGLLFIPLAFAAGWALFFLVARPQGPWEWAAHVVLGELAVAAILFFTIGFLWAITGNRLLKALLDAAAAKLAWVLIPIAVPVFVAVVFVLIGGR